MFDKYLGIDIPQIHAPEQPQKLAHLSWTEQQSLVLWNYTLR